MYSAGPAELGGPRAATQDSLSWPRAGVASAVDHQLTIHQNILDTPGVRLRMVECGAVGAALRLEATTSARYPSQGRPPSRSRSTWAVRPVILHTAPTPVPRHSQSQLTLNDGRLYAQPSGESDNP